MQEIENEAVEQEIAQEVASPTVDAAREMDSETVNTEDKSNRAFAELRIQKRELERKAKMQEELLHELMNQRTQTQAAMPPEEDMIEQLAKQEYVAGETVAKALRKMEQKMNSQVDEVKKSYATQRGKSSFEEGKAACKDFDQVVTPETLDLIEENNPRLAASLAKSMTEDPYSFAIQSYSYIKAQGLSKSNQSKKMTETEKKIEQNKKSVPSPQVYDKRPMAQAFKPTEEMRKELHQEMIGYARQVGMGY
jgi:hypothetical protein